MTTENTQVAVRKETPLSIVCANLKSPAFKAQVSEALPPGVDPERFVRTALVAIQSKPEIAETGDRQSLYNAVVRAASMKLLPDGREGALVLYNEKVGNAWIKKVQFQPMVAGIIKRFADVGINAYAATVYENELPKFRLWNDDEGQHVIHEPMTFGDRGAMVGVFACGRTPEGRVYVEAMGLEDIDRVMRASKSKDQQGNPVGPWKDWKDRMAQKSALHRLGRRMPISDDKLAEIIEADRDLAEHRHGEPATDTPETAQAAPSAPRTRPSALDRVTSHAAAQEPDDAIDGEFTAVEDPRPVSTEGAPANGDNEPHF